MCSTRTCGMTKARQLPHHSESHVPLTASQGRRHGSRAAKRLLENHLDDHHIIRDSTPPARALLAPRRLQAWGRCVFAAAAAFGSDFWAAGGVTRSCCGLLKGPGAHHPQRIFFLWRTGSIGADHPPPRAHAPFEPLWVNNWHSIKGLISDRPSRIISTIYLVTTASSETASPLAERS